MPAVRARSICRRRWPCVRASLEQCISSVFSQQLLSCEELHDVPFLILGNKIDLGRAASEDELRVELGLHHLTTGKVGALHHERSTCSIVAFGEHEIPSPAFSQGKVALNGIRPMELFMCSVVKRAGYGEGAHSRRFAERPLQSWPVCQCVSSELTVRSTRPASARLSSGFRWLSNYIN